MARWEKGGLFEQADSWYFVFLIVAALLLWSRRRRLESRQGLHGRADLKCARRSCQSARRIRARGGAGRAWIGHWRPPVGMFPTANWLSGAFRAGDRRFPVSRDRELSALSHRSLPAGSGRPRGGHLCGDARQRFSERGYPQPLRDDFPWQLPPAAQKSRAPEGDDPIIGQGPMPGARSGSSSTCSSYVGWIVIESLFLAIGTSTCACSRWPSC